LLGPGALGALILGCGCGDGAGALTRGDDEPPPEGLEGGEDLVAEGAG